MSNKENQVLVIMLANTAEEYYRQMTNTALNTLDSNCGCDVELGCVLVETNPKAERYKQDWVKTYCPNESFNYNRFLNLGYEYAKTWWPEFFAENDALNKYVLIVNNDLIFRPNWLLELINGLEENGLDSVSPRSPGWFQHQNYTTHSLTNGVFEGWGIGFEYTGWAIMHKKESYDKLHPFDEDYQFWCSDNAATLTMRKLGMRHALIASSEVQHLTSRSHGLIPDGKHHEWTEGMCEILRRKTAEGKYD